MPRRNQQKKRNKRHRKGSYDGRGSQHVAENHNRNEATSLEEDLRQQRIRQQERQKVREREEEERKEKQQQGLVLGEDDICNDDIGFQQPQKSSAMKKAKHLIMKGSLLPASIASLQQNGSHGSNCSHKSSMSSSSFPSSVITLPPSFLLRHIEQSSPILTIYKRNTLRKIWSTQHHLESTTIRSRAASLYCKTKWPQYMLEYSSNLKCSWDLSCKHRLHPSARTFDVAVLDPCSEPSPSPTIATIFQDGWGLLRQQSQHKINTIKAPSVYAIRMHESSKTCGMIVRPASDTNDSFMSPYSFRWYPLPHATSYVEANLPRPVTDFCFGNEIALFSCPRHSTLSSESLNPLFLPLVEADGMRNTTYYDSPVRTLNVRNFPQSDALRIEMMCKEQEKILGFGHRNGQVSIIDLRATGTLCSILQCELKNVGHPLGSVSDFGFLSSGQQHQVLVKRSFGSCQLHDMRKSMSSPSPSPYKASYHTSTTVVRNMTVPQDEINPIASANCNGFFIDPNSRQTMMSPYIASSSGDARLGVWSLGTGRMVGSRLLQKANKEYGAEQHSSLHVEVCSKITPLVLSNQERKANDDFSSSAFGVWMKCGAFTSQKLPSKVGSLHQLSIPGLWEHE